MAAEIDPVNLEVLFGNSASEIRDGDYEPLKQICGPLTTQSVTLVSGHAGVGKSLWTLALAAHIAAGEDFEDWRTPEPRGVLYVDGELTPWQLQARLAGNPIDDRLHVLHRDWLQKRGWGYFNVGDSYHQAWLTSERTLACFDVVIFDTVTALLHPEEEQSIFHPEYWLQVNELNTTWKNAGKAVVWIDHLSKSGETYGTSAKKWTVDNEWLLTKLEEPPAEATAAFNIEVGKCRNLPNTTAESIWKCGENYGWKRTE